MTKNNNLKESMKLANESLDILYGRKPFMPTK